MGLREIAKEKRRRRILDEARALIEREGLSGLSMRRLAEAAELSTRTLYNLYGAKETILFALLEERMEDLERSLESAAQGDPIDGSRRLLTLALDIMCGQGSLHRSLLWELEANPRWGREFLLMGRVRSLHEEALRAAVHAGLIDARFCPRLIAHNVLMSFGQGVRLWARGILDEQTLRAQVMYTWASHLLAASTELSRPRLLDEVLELSGALDSVIERLDGIASDPETFSEIDVPPSEGAAALVGCGGRPASVHHLPRVRARG